MHKLKKPQKVGGFDDLFGYPASILAVEHEGLDLLVLDAPELFDRDGGPYVDTAGLDYIDNFRRFAALSLAAAEIAGGTAAELEAGSRPCATTGRRRWRRSICASARPTACRSVLTIHNIAFQGQFGPQVFPELGAAAGGLLRSSCVEYFGDVGFLKGGLQTASAITTVSPSYAEEILDAGIRHGPRGPARRRALSDLIGIVNGIDADVWNPQTDKHIAENYRRQRR